MHMADALVSPAVAGTMMVCSAAAAAYSIHRVRLEDDQKKIPMMGVMGAFVFAAQMINFSIPGTGSSGHLCGGMLLTGVLGPFGAFLSMIGVLVIQCLLFADGGLLALGCNIWNMAFYGCFVGGLVIWRLMMKKKMTRGRIIAASILACIITLQMGAFSVVLETKASGITELPMGTFMLLMQPIHLAIGLVEGLITAAVLVFIYETRPELLYGYSGHEQITKEGTVTGKAQHRGGQWALKEVVIVLAVCAAVIGGGLSLVASSDPDGLEWSIERVTGATELTEENEYGGAISESNVGVYDGAGAVQESTSLLPDYAFPDSESALGTTVSGLVGGLVVALVCTLACYLFRFFRRKPSAAKS